MYCVITVDDLYSFISNVSFYTGFSLKYVCVGYNYVLSYDNCQLNSKFYLKTRKYYSRFLILKKKYWKENE